MSYWILIIKGPEIMWAGILLSLMVLITIDLILGRKRLADVRLRLLLVAKAIKV
jgi:hypothetical protein